MTKVSFDAIVKNGGEDITVLTTPGTVRVFKHNTGDINLDGTVSINDVVLLLQHSLFPDLYPVDYIDNMDFNHDNSIDIKDVVALLQFSLFPELYPLS
jgi:hypothetical protein